MGFPAESIDMLIRSSTMFWQVSEIFGATVKNVK